jgi:subtilisin family serine protease
MPLALALLIVALASPAPPAPAFAASAAGSEPVMAEDAQAPLSAEGRFIVILDEDASVDRATERAGRLGIRADRTFRHAVRGFAARLTPGQAAQLRADPDVEAVVHDEIISMAAQSIPTGVRRVGGRDNRIAAINGKDDRVDADVAIVDTGIGGSTSRAHEDLNIAGGINCARDGAPNQAWGDPNGHGTHVAGTVGALDNGRGVVGVAPGARLWAVRILNSAGDGLISWYVCGLDWITAQRENPDDPTSRPLIEVVNMSVAKKGEDDRNCGLTNKDLMHQAICRLVASGVMVVAAAGNDGFSAANLKPASYNEVITVSALADTDGKPGGTGGDLCYSWSTYDRDDTFADFSNYGGDVDLIAPGKCIWSTLPGDRYGYISGTSMAAPHVAGAAALFKASRPLATPAQVRAALRAAGTQDWNTATDPDSTHEPLLDVSHIVALGDWTLDVSPDSSGGPLVGAAGGTVRAPVRLYRAEDAADAVSLSVAAEAPLTATLADATLTGLEADRTILDVGVPENTPTGTYTVTVTATDGSRDRTSTYRVNVDSTRPTALAPALALRSGSTLIAGMASVGAWSAASDAGGSITRYEVRWRVDGNLGNITALSSSTRQVSRSMQPGHTYALRLRARDAAGNWSLWQESQGFAPRLSQDTSSTLIRKGTWTRYSSASRSGGTSLSSRAKGASLKRKFTGRAVAVVVTRGSTKGRADIYIDGTRVTTVDTYRSSTAYQSVIFARNWTTPGAHSVSVVVLGTSGRPRVEVDAFVIVP